ncbi:MAG: sulfotransferase [Proteobacteria bacterium]|nr:sulfotransferase [Pseudomonadota bacterium]
MARDLKADQELLRQVLSLAQNRDHQRAAALAEQALAEGFEHPLLLNVAATRREEQGRLEEALTLLERGVALAPADVPVRNALALVLQRLERPQEALEHLEVILAQHPQLPFVHASKGNALIALGSLGLAQASHQRALELDPDNLAAMGSLASIATHRGEHLVARRWAERLLARVPGFPDAVLSLAAADLAGGAASQAESALRALLADARAGATDRARAHGLLGDVLDALGRYREAFEAYRAGNELTRQLYARFAEPSLLTYATRLVGAFAAVAPRWPTTVAPARTGDAPAQHVLLIGFPRSGTTLLEVILDGHPGVVSLEEHDLFAEGVRQYLHNATDLRALADASEAELQALRADYWRRVRAGGAEVGGKVFLDKHPLNTLKLPLIARLFPQAKILFARRDPRDVVLSCFRRRFRMNPAMYQMLTLASAAQLYDATMDLAQRAQGVLGLAWQDVRYERLMADFAGESRRICEFIGIQWTPGMSEFAGRVQSRENATPSTAQLARGLDRSGVGHWRHYREHIAPLEPVLARWIALYGVAS